MRFQTLKSRLEDVAFTTPTPFDSDDRIAQGKLAENLQKLEGVGANLFIPCGNTGEFYSLTPTERAEVVQTHVDATEDKSTVVAGVAGSTETVTQTIERYEEIGVDAVMVMHPDHTYTHEQGLAEYYSEIATSTDLGVVVYKRNHDVSRETLKSTVTHENVVGVKYAVNDIDAFSAAVSNIGDRVVWLNGIAERFAPSFAIEGAEGFTTGIGNFAPEHVLELRDAIDAREWERARQIRNHLRPLEDLREESGVENSTSSANNVPVVKYGMELAGYHGGPVREPLADLSERDKERTEEYYERLQRMTISS